MKTLNWRKTGLFLIIILLLSGIPGVVLAQLSDDEPHPEVPISGDPAAYPDLDSSDEELAEPHLILAEAPATMNYQGYLTDASGLPYNGTVDVIASLYNAPAAGIRVWGPEGSNDVPVVNGLFEIVLGAGTQLYPDAFDEALFLELSIDGTVMPRQPLRASAYAFGLVPGAEVDGTPGNSLYALTVINDSTDPTSRGMFVQGKQYGLYVAEDGAGDTAIYSPDYIHGKGFRSNDDSYVFAAAASGVPWDEPKNSLLLLDPQKSGTMAIALPTAPGIGYFYLPVNVPAVLLGQNVTIEELTVYYQVTAPSSFITEVNLVKGTGAGLSTDLLLDGTNLTSTTATSRSYTPATATLDSDSGWIVVRFTLDFSGAADFIRIGGVRLRLGHN